MLLSDWITKVDQLMNQLSQGAITEIEFYNAVLFYAMHCDVSSQNEKSK